MLSRGQADSLATDSGEAAQRLTELGFCQVPDQVVNDSPVEFRDPWNNSVVLIG